MTPLARVIAPLALPWALACASDLANVVADGQEGAPGVRRVLLCPPNLLVGLRSEIASGAEPAEREVAAYLESRGRRVERLTLQAGVEMGSPAADAALAEAEAQSRAALALARDSASAWYGLGRTLQRAGRSDEAFGALTTARRFGWSAPLDVTLARLHLERGERERAAGLLRPIAQDPHGGPVQEEAARLLEQALR